MEAFIINVSPLFFLIQAFDAGHLLLSTTVAASCKFGYAVFSFPFSSSDKGFVSNIFSAFPPDLAICTMGLFRRVWWDFLVLGDFPLHFFFHIGGFSSFAQATFSVWFQLFYHFCCVFYDPGCSPPWWNFRMWRVMRRVLYLSVTSR